MATLKHALPLDELRERAGEVAGLLKILSHPNRLLVACELMEGECSVSEIEARTGVAQPNLSRDLARLRAAGLVVGAFLAGVALARFPFNAKRFSAGRIPEICQIAEITGV